MKNLESNISKLIIQGDATKVFINELGQKVYQPSVIEIDAKILRQLAKQDSSVNALVQRVKSSDYKLSKLQTTISFAVEALDSLSTTTFIANNIYYPDTLKDGSVDSTNVIRSKRFVADDGTLSIEATSYSDLSRLDINKYKATIGGVNLDIFREGRQLIPSISLDNPNLSLGNISVMTQKLPNPKLVFSVGLGANLGYNINEKKIVSAPGLYLGVGIPFYTIY